MSSRGVGARLATLTGLFFGGSAASKLLSFALLPVYTRVLSTSEFGYFDVSVAYATVVGSILFMDLWVGVLRLMRLEDEYEPGAVVTAGVVLIFGSFVALIAVGCVVNALGDFQYIWLVIFYAITGALRDFWCFVARGYGRNVEFVLSGLANSFVSLTLNVVLLVFMGKGVGSLYLAYIVGNIVQGVWLSLRCGVLKSIRNLDLAVLSTCRAIMIFALPLGANSSAFWLANNLGKFVVLAKLSLYENGLYAVGFKLGAMITVFSGALIMAWQDILFDASADESHSRFGATVPIFLACSSICVVGALPVIDVLFPFFIGRGFDSARNLVPGFAIAAALGAFSSMLGNIFYAIRRTGDLLWSTLAGLCVTLLLTLPAVDVFGVNGATAALSAGFCATAAVRIIVLRRRISLHFPLRFCFVLLCVIVWSCWSYVAASLLGQIGAFVVGLGVCYWFVRSATIGALFRHRGPVI